MKVNIPNCDCGVGEDKEWPDHSMGCQYRCHPIVSTKYILSYMKPRVNNYDWRTALENQATRGEEFRFANDLGVAVKHLEGLLDLIEAEDEPE